MTFFGIDEAGKGPIIGPLVMAAVCVKDLGVLEQMNVKDSKLLTPQQREDLFDELVNALTEDEFRIVEISPAIIDKAVRFNNFNWLEADYTVDLINHFRPTTVIVDCPSRNIRAYKEYIFERLIQKPQEIFCEYKADANYPIVAAASILAKVTRDRIVAALHKEVGVDFGSGYLTDPKTKPFLKECWQTHAKLFRKSWAPYRILQNAAGQQKLGDF
ncbi:ribonuclease HII [Candidatus Woesearchaeota archaeon]|nr:ribonuclease HII [Candidatus Woesearchaeota archaeon]